MPRLMVVDDEADVREYLKSYFKRRKIEVVTAESGEEALSLLENQPAPDLMLLDIRMGGIDGIETLRRMREAGRQLRVIMVTGVEDQKILQRLAEFNVLACVHKPLMLDELEKEVLQRIVMDV
ncbi:MAG: response regulator [Candidatus Omnitrophica bacterium]|nr:response regulator [Candidatus Omnitrophota bacterium]MDD5573836.1 response regulator [Candidatus Omnitrophota bacterium]